MDDIHLSLQGNSLYIVLVRWVNFPEGPHRLITKKQHLVFERNPVLLLHFQKINLGYAQKSRIIVEKMDKYTYDKKRKWKIFFHLLEIKTTRLAGRLIMLSL